MFGYIPNIVSFFDFEGLICVVREVYFRFKGLGIRQTPSINGCTPTAFRRFYAAYTWAPAP